MSIKPIEYQLSIPKSFEASKNQQNHLKSMDINALQDAISGKEEISKRMQTVNDSEKTEKKDFKNGSENKRRQENNKEKNTRDEEIEKEEIVFEAGKIDIII